MLRLYDQKILGIDPGLATLGFGIVQGNRVLDYGVITTGKNVPHAERLRRLEADMMTLCSKWKPSRVGFEMPFFRGENTNQANVLEAVGVIKLAIWKSLQTEPILLYPSQVKAAVAHGRASKKEVQEAVKTIYGLKFIPQPDDAADGIAIATAIRNGVRKIA